MRISLSVDELIEIESALENHYSAFKSSTFDIGVASYKVSKALGRPWVERYPSAKAAGEDHLKGMMEQEDLLDD